MKMRYLVALFVLITSPALAQTNPCTTQSTQAVLQASGANRFFAELTDHAATLPDGTPVTVDYQFAAWLASSNTGAPPAQGPTTIPKSAFVAVPGFANCYELTGGLPGLIPQAQPMVAGLRARSQPNAPQPFSGWAVSNSFLLASTSVTAPTPGPIRVRPPQ